MMVVMLADGFYPGQMELETATPPLAAAAATVASGHCPADAPALREIAAGSGWSVGEFTCRLGPQDRPFEERHASVTLAVIAEGSFQYRSASGRALLYPGAILLGNAGAGYECSHDHACGDRCIAFEFEPGYFAELAGDVMGAQGFRLAIPMLPALPELMPLVVEIGAGARGASRLAMDELAVRLVEKAVTITRGGAGAPGAPTLRDERRISRVLRHIEEQAAEPLDLAALADVAGQSKYHFLRTFRQTVGLTPYQFVLGRRMARVAAGLRTTKASVATIAFDAGFGDLSTFNHRFRHLFAASPSRFRTLTPRRGNSARS